MSTRRTIFILMEIGPLPELSEWLRRQEVDGWQNLDVVPGHKTAENGTFGVVRGMAWNVYRRFRAFTHDVEVSDIEFSAKCDAGGECGYDK
jgi:hypothetical protein